MTSNKGFVCALGCQVGVLILLDEFTKVLIAGMVVCGSTAMIADKKRGETVSDSFVQAVEGSRSIDISLTVHIVHRWDQLGSLLRLSLLLVGIRNHTLPPL